RLTLVSPVDAVEPLQRAAERFREEGDVEGELVAVANLGRVAWWHQKIGPLIEMGPRVAELEATGHPFARALAACGRALFADLSDDDQKVLDELAAVVPGSLDPAWDAMASWMRANVIAGVGDTEAAAAEVARFPPSADPNFTLTVEGLRIIVTWMAGRVDEVFERFPAMLARIRAVGMVQNLGVALAGAARLYAHGGDVETGRRHYDEAVSLTPDGVLNQPARLATAAAAIHLAEGDEELAGDVLARGLRAHTFDRGVDRRVWRHTLPMSYVLVPETREHWETADLYGFVDRCRTLARAVVAARAGGDDELLRTLDLPDIGLVRAVLHNRFAADLAVGLEAAGHPGAPALLEAIGPVGRSVVRELGTTGPTRQTRSARALLSAVPAPPATVTELAVLGPLTIRRDGAEVDDPILRRERLRALLAFLVTHRETHRGAIVAALWPDLDERSAANNLRVTLTYLLRLLEPWRAAGESAFHVRTSGQRVGLVTGDWLRIDVDVFDERIAAAARAEADGTPSLALEHTLAAVELYRGDLHSGVPEAEWNQLERDHYRSRFVAAATRAAQLLAARGDADEAEAVARRAIAADPWAEDAYAVLVTTALDRGDRSAARRALDRCLEALADLGVEPSEATQRLRRRARSAGR
ncbi:MAG TPA: BTAD domain-containing putative transcriptional regulator, partial [Acidimicrobiales bacterium]